MSRLLVIGLDGATLDLIEPWAAAGKLPFFARLLGNGRVGRLRSVPNTDTAPAWSTFATGLNPGRHGLFHEHGWDTERRTLRPMRGGDRRGASFWAAASAAGKRVIAINVPFSYPAEQLNGVVVAGIDAPDERAPDFCRPPEFLSAFQRSHGVYRIDSRISQFIKQDQPAEGLQAAYAVAEKHAAALCFALEQYPDWELAVLVFSMPDEAQHFFWRQMDAGSGPQHDAILAAHRFLENQIAAIMAVAGPDTNLLLASDHGFGPICATPELLAEQLRQTGFLIDLPPTRRSLPAQLLAGTYGILRDRLGESAKEALRRALPGLRSRVESDARFAGIDWRSSRAYVGANPWEVFVNLRGREPQGCVEPGANYERLIGELSSMLLNWRDEQGRLRLRRVLRRDEVYTGPFLDQAPDLTLEYDPAAAPPPETLPGNRSRFDADHQPEGLFIAYGPQIAAGTRLLEPMLQDVAPTALRLLGLPYDHCDGKPLV